MRSILSDLVASSVLAGVAAPAAAGDEPFDARGFFEYLQNHSG